VTTIDASNIKAMCWVHSDGPAGVGIYQVDERGCPHKPIIHVEMTATEMAELAFDLLNAARDIDAGAVYGARMSQPLALTPEDQEVILELLRKAASSSLTCDYCGDRTETWETRTYLGDHLNVCHECAVWIDAENVKEPE